MNERRTSSRQRLARTTPGRILITLRDTSRAAILQDVSRGGVGLVVRHAVEPDSLLCVDFAHLDPFLARVEHSTAQADGTWLIGCTFLDPPDRATLQALLA
ncbi:MAG: PilZ domain-containing protein [Gemmataceae bacterium]|nr:PilZ domain-containing protein [Gemmataceae bacterium]